jgi:hypothetical protein
METMKKILIICLITLLSLGCIDVQTSSLNVGETGISNNDMQISFDKYETINEFNTWNEWYLLGKLKKDNYETFYPTENSKLLMIHITAKYIGDYKSSDDTIITNSYTLMTKSGSDTPYILYKGNKIEIEPSVSPSSPVYQFYASASKYNPQFRDYGEQYPNTVKEGWIMFVVPSNIDLNETTLNIEGLKWNFINVSKSD